MNRFNPCPFAATALTSLTLLSLSAHAQTPPDAGQVLRETAPAMVSPAEGNPATGVQPNEAAPADAAARIATHATIAIKSVRITGNQAFSESELLALVVDLPNSPRSLADLQQAAARISKHYREAGYLVARAYLPQQKLEDGALTIAVLEGKLSDVKVSNSSRLMDAKVQAFLTNIPRNSPPQANSVNRPVLLLGDVPGVGAVDARLAAGAEVGETVLNIHAGEAPLVQGRVEGDNFGGLYTGRYRAGGSLVLNSPLGYGERFSARLLVSDAQLVSGRLAADLPLGSDGLTVSAALGRTTYELGDTFKALDAGGRSDTIELSLRYPILRSAQSNLYAQLGVENRELKDEVRSAGTETNKSAQVATLNLFGDWRDRLMGGGIIQASMGLSSGKLKIDSADAAELDAIAAKTAGSYSKWVWSLSRQQAVAKGATFGVSLRGQQVSKNLDSSEKFSLGGPYGVRAYASGEASGDEGWLGSLEMRYGLTDHIAASVFHDFGRVSINAKPYLDGSNTLKRSGTGFGLQGDYGSFDWLLNFAWRGSEPGTAEDDKTLRVWAQAGWRF